MTAALRILSGLGGKQPAAFLLDTEQGRLLIEAGGPLEPGLPCDWEWPQDRPVNAVVISHDHVDHMGAIDRVPKGTPLYATEPVAAALPAGIEHCVLPLQGELELLGIRVCTGQAGHSLGGVWLHFDVGDGLFYSGDFSTESTLFRFDTPPDAELAMLDASYGLYDQPQNQCREELLTHLNTPTLLPVPASGRALEMALWLDENGIDWSMDDLCLQQLARMQSMPASCFQPGVFDRLKRLQPCSALAQSQIALVGRPEGIGEDIEQLISRGQRQVIYTGYLPPKAQRDVAEGRARWLRWNVHPRCSDLQRLAQQIQAKRVIPLFTSLTERQQWQRALDPCLFIPTTDEIQLS